MTNKLINTDKIFVFDDIVDHNYQKYIQQIVFNKINRNPNNQKTNKLAERGGFADLSPESTTYLKYTSLSPLLATKKC